MKTRGQKRTISPSAVMLLLVAFISIAVAQNEPEMGPTPMPGRTQPQYQGQPQTQPGSDLDIAYSPPAGWKVSALTQSRFKVASGPPSNGFVPNITIAEAAYPGTTEQFLAENLRTMKQQDDVRILSQSSFNTKSGLKGIKLVYEMTKDKQTFRNTQYIFNPGSGQPLVLVNCATAAADGGRFNSLFDQSISTFRVK